MPHFLAPLVHAPDSTFCLINETTGKTVASNLEPAFDSRTRRMGLLHRQRLDRGTALVLAPCAAIHTLFMRFPIDVIFVARDGTVAKVCPRIQPWRAAASLGAFAAIELAGGEAVESGTAAGDTLRLSSRPATP